jgi:hypothetical protein
MAAERGGGGGLVPSEDSKSRLLANCAVSHALLRALDEAPLSLAGPGVEWDMGEQPGGKTSHKVILTDASVASIPEVQSMLLLRDVQQQVLFDATTDLFVWLLAADGKVPAAAVFCTMWNSYNGDILGALQEKWGQQHLMQPGPAKLLEDPTGGTNVVQLVLKMLHLSKMAWPQVKTQVASIIKELREKAPLTD